LAYIPHQKLNLKGFVFNDRVLLREEFTIALKTLEAWWDAGSNSRVALLSLDSQASVRQYA
jgi:hypothetical protein